MGFASFEALIIVFVSFLLGSGIGAVTVTAQPTDGQLLIGDTGSDPVLASLTAPAAGITITGGAGSITFALADDLAGIEALSGTGLVSRTAADTYVERTIIAPAAGITVTNGGGVAGNPTLALADDLAALEGIGTTGIATRTAADTWTTRTLTAPAAGFTITNANGVAGNPTFALADDLAGLEALSGTGLVARTAANTYTERTITSTDSSITITNGDGVAGNPDLSITAFSTREIFFDASDFNAIETNFAPLSTLAGTNVNMQVRLFDDTTEEYVNQKFQVPGDINTSGTVTFRSYVTAATAAASKNIGLTFGHLALNDSEDWDPASPYTEEDSGATAIDATQDDVTEVIWTETVSNLGWAANDVVLFRVSRDTGVANDLVGDLRLLSFCIEIPRV